MATPNDEPPQALLDQLPPPALFTRLLIQKVLDDIQDRNEWDGDGAIDATSVVPGGDRLQRVAIELASQLGMGVADLQTVVNCFIMPINAVLSEAYEQYRKLDPEERRRDNARVIVSTMVKIEGEAAERVRSSLGKPQRNDESTQVGVCRCESGPLMRGTPSAQYPSEITDRFTTIEERSSMYIGVPTYTGTSAAAEPNACSPVRSKVFTQTVTAQQGPPEEPKDQETPTLSDRSSSAIDRLHEQFGITYDKKQKKRYSKENLTRVAFAAEDLLRSARRLRIDEEFDGEAPKGGW